MKKFIIIIILLFLSSLSLCAQTYMTREEQRSQIKNPNTLYLVLQPIDMGVGVRYDRMFTTKWGSYISLTYGKYELETGEKIDNHYKVVSGVLLYLKPLCEFYQPYLGFGLSFNGYDGLHNIPSTFPTKALNVWSIELSCNAKISNNWNFGIRVDPVKWESSIDIGVSF